LGIDERRQYRYLTQQQLFGTNTSHHVVHDMFVLTLTEQTHYDDIIVISS